MEDLMRPARLRDRILIWVEEEIRAGTLPSKSDVILRAVTMQGELTRAEAVELLGLTERSARRVTSALLEIGASIIHQHPRAAETGLSRQTGRALDAGLCSLRNRIRADQTNRLALADCPSVLRLAKPL